MRAEDYQRDPCQCPDCRQAGVQEKPQIRDRMSGAWLHGYDLKRWWEARDKFWADWNDAKSRVKGMR